MSFSGMDENHAIPTNACDTAYAYRIDVACACGILQLRRPEYGQSLYTTILDFRGFDSNIILSLRGGNSQAHREFPGNLESTNLSREILSREIGRKLTRSGCWPSTKSRGGGWAGCPSSGDVRRSAAAAVSSRSSCISSRGYVRFLIFLRRGALHAK